MRRRRGGAAKGCEICGGVTRGVTAAWLWAGGVAGRAACTGVGGCGAGAAAWVSGVAAGGCSG